jgi:SAM-dependent methyltransferase
VPPRFPLHDGSAPELPHSPAAQRNAEPILAELRRLLPPSGRILEIASGTGQHAVGFANALPRLEWQPSDVDPRALETVRTRVERAGLSNLHPPVYLDVEAGEWPVQGADAVVCVNLLHIAPWSATRGLLAGAARCLSAGGVLLIYGPFRVAGEHTAPSNARFDADLRARNTAWGIRDSADVAAIARAHGLDHEDTIALPANNHLLVFRRR